MSNNLPEFLSGGGELGERIRSLDWSETPLGPASSWPQSLRTCIRIMLTSRQPIWLGWGKELIKLYNDPYIAIVGGKHPWALGAPASQVWKDIWNDIGPMLQKVMEQDEGTYVESQLLIMERNGYPEETYYTFSYTPIPGDDGKTAGMICFNTDDTERIISERQLRTLTQLGKNLTDCKSNPEVAAKTIATLQENPYDFPFALYFGLQDNKAVLSSYTHEELPRHTLPGVIDLDAEDGLALLFRNAAATRQVQVLETLQPAFGTMPKGIWKVTPSRAIILPIIQGAAAAPYGFLVIGQNPYRLLDEKYSSFFSLIADQVATSFANVHALEEERKRVAALAEIDKAKTIFFSNISHEFRTPLTLLLGPAEEALNDAQTLPANRARLELIHRNALRMQKLVNTLLEFSRIEAGRMEGRFSRVDISALTGDLASVFRSAIEHAGMELEIVQEEIHGEVYVDIDMWERIILNLVSNAFKYSIGGRIRIEIKQVDTEVHVLVSDTGVGIAPDQLDKIFDRFYRVEHTSGRSQEGTGIGLAMVKELVRLHQGSIQVSSEQGKGSVFTVAIPLGKDHLTAGKIVETPAGMQAGGHAVAFVEEARKWILPAVAGNTRELAAASAHQSGQKSNGTATRHKVLLADDNTDMRDYVYRLLSDQYEVITAVDGEEAFNCALLHQPDLLLSDIMMPKLDGLGLLKKIRSHTTTMHTPVILLSARAGEEAKIEGIASGADDYLVKPFSAKELVAKVDTHIKMAQSRKQTELLLESMVRERTAELQRSNDDLLQFAHVASHDLKEPVRKIRIFEKRLLDEYGSLLPEKGQAYVQKVLTATDRMLAVVNGILSYSSISGSDQPFERIDLNGVIKGIESDLELLIQQKDAIIQSDNLPTIEGAPILIHQLFYNIIQNALKFSREGERPFISITGTIATQADHRPWLEILVSDNGIGFDEMYATKIFDTFARLNPASEYDGTGLGLALCKKIVERHGGKIAARGVKNKGASFLISLPPGKIKEPT